MNGNRKIFALEHLQKSVALGICCTILASATAQAVFAQERTPAGNDREATADAAGQSSAADSSPSFFVTSVTVSGNTLLSNRLIDETVYDFLGPQKTFDDIERMRSTLESVYQKNGYMSVAVSIPEQTAAPDGNLPLRLDVLEQPVGELTIKGNRRISERKIRESAQSMRPGVVPNFKDVERDIVALNKTADRRVTPSVQLGKVANTVDIELNIEERSPWHVSADLNNRHSANTSSLRASVTGSYNDLWGRGDIISITAQTAPQRTADGKVYSASYVAAIPASRMQLVGYAVRTDSAISIVSNDLTVLGKGSIYGLRTVIPLSGADGFSHSFNFGFDRKHFDETLRLQDNSTRGGIQYTTLAARYQSARRSKFWQIDFGSGATFGLRGLGDEAESFDAKRIKSRANFFHLHLDTQQTYTTSSDWQIAAEWNAAWAGRPLISNEQFGIGGMESVRGYYESEALGDYGAGLQLELRTPRLKVGANGSRHWLDELRAYVFADSAVVAIHEPLPEQSASSTLFSAGVGMRLRLWDVLSASCDVAVPLRDGPADTPRGKLGIVFQISGEF